MKIENIEYNFAENKCFFIIFFNNFVLLKCTYLMLTTYLMLPKT